jgi:hypothetical protein
MPVRDNPPRLLTYKFVVGNADANHEVRLHQAAEQGYKPTFVLYDDTAARISNRGVVVLMERQP